jgi:hypothetical protein
MDPATTVWRNDLREVFMADILRIAAVSAPAHRQSFEVLEPLGRTRIDPHLG